MGLSASATSSSPARERSRRNFAYGAALGRGDDLGGLKLAEGVHSAGVAARLAEERGIEAPIIRAVAEVLAGRIGVDAAVQGLLARPLRRESD